MEEKEIQNTESNELKYYWYMLLENKTLFTIVFFVIFIFIIIITLLQKPIYQSSATILIENKNYGSEIFSLNLVNPRQTMINNHIEMIHSRALLERVVNGIPKDSSLHKIYDGNLSKEQKISIISRQLSVNPVKDTDILKIVYKDGEPYAAYAITNLIINEYYNMNLEMTRGQYSEVSIFLNEQLQKIEKELATAEEKLKMYKEGKSITVLSEETNMLVNTLSGFQERYKTTEIELNTLNTKLNILQKNLSQTQKSLAKGIINTTSPTIERLINQITALETDYADYLAQGYDENHPKIKEIQYKIENIKKQIIEESKTLLKEEQTLPVSFSEDMISNIIELQVEIQTKQAMLNTLKKVVNEYENKLKNVPLKELELARLERDKRVSEELYLMLRSKYEESKIAEAGQLGSIRIVDRPLLPKSPIFPRTKRNIVLGFFLSLVLASGLIIIKEYFDDSIKNIDDLERQLNIKILGSIPAIKLHENNNVKNGDRIKERLINKLSEGNPVIESYKILRTNILYLANNNVKTITVSSATKGEGKSTTISNLALTLTNLNKKVLIVDADLRKPIITKIFDINVKEGLTHLIKNENDYKNYIVKTVFDNLYVLPHGERTHNSTELFENQKIKHIIEQLTNDFDFVLFDTPPILSVADPAIISQYTDGLLWVVQFKKVKKQELNYAKKLLENLQTNILGVVVNNINLTNPYGKYYYNYYYHHEDDE